MTVIETQKDADALTLTFVAEFEAPRERVWQLWADPRQLERWWGPPGYPATFEKYDFEPGGEADYYMTTPEGEKPRGWWRMLAIDPPSRLEFEYGFSNDDGTKAPGDPARGIVTFEERDGVTRMTTLNRFPSAGEYAESMEMGMEEGMRQAMGQIDDLLAEVPS
ncbi:SRPBCC domain-containing protein [Leifsonia sp. F6_8S_P_1B]|uniref:SRPBCC domain-containing protein n=1 Tax=Leifsonia williamsii TaxID=3035919 RepID=A0ABT8K7B2_9MICO|nr:SRPBCC domain-containing protein [Leifsonia williamsii]MDN4613345.1 SRPBCC domain-containing protein [Leifsonia williamsii]